MNDCIPTCKQPHALPFEFPYYGHIIHNVSVTSGGFLYASDFLQRDLIPLTQNIAPLQADFNPQVNDTAKVFIYSASRCCTARNNVVCWLGKRVYEIKYKLQQGYLRR